MKICFCMFLLPKLPLACRNSGELLWILFKFKPASSAFRMYSQSLVSNQGNEGKRKPACSSDCLPTTNCSLTGIRNSAMTVKMYHFWRHHANSLVLMPNLSVAHIKSQVLAWTNMLVACRFVPFGVAFPRPTLQMRMLITCLCHGLRSGFLAPWVRNCLSDRDDTQTSVSDKFYPDIGFVF